MKRSTLLYLLVFGLVCAGIVWILRAGAVLPPPDAANGISPTAVVHAPATAHGSDALLTGLGQNFAHPLSRLLLQIILIVAVARLVGRIFAIFGQPSVVGEMAAGILLGPSVFGFFAPSAFSFVFAADSLGTLNLLSQVGVCLFMFAVGMELNADHLRHQPHVALVVSYASIVFPYLLGVAAAYVLYAQFAAAGASFTPFALFMGISMSITAFPVLARILQERRLTHTRLGSTAIACAAINDVTAWNILAFVVAIARASNLAGAVLNLLFVAAFVAVMLCVVRPALPRFLRPAAAEDEEPSRATLAAAVCLVMASALATEVIGIHALFGAFLAGAIMPETGGFRRKLAVRVENFSSVLLLPIFFAFTGLRTQFGLLNDWQSWLICLGIVVVATAGKLGGSAISARFTGMAWRDSWQLGALMNTRGLMELIALNIGYDMGILSPRIFAMLVLMAIATTALTGPLLTLFRERATSMDGLPQASR